MVDRTGPGLGARARGRQQCELGRPEPEQHLREKSGVPLLHAHGAGEPPGLLRYAGGEPRGGLAVGAVLQEPGEEDVARLEECEVLLVLDIG